MLVSTTREQPCAYIYHVTIRSKNGRTDFMELIIEDHPDIVLRAGDQVGESLFGFDFVVEWTIFRPAEREMYISLKDERVECHSDQWRPLLEEVGWHDAP